MCETRVDVALSERVEKMLPRFFSGDFQHVTIEEAYLLNRVVFGPAEVPEMRAHLELCDDEELLGLFNFSRTPSVSATRWGRMASAISARKCADTDTPEEG